MKMKKRKFREKRVATVSVGMGDERVDQRGAAALWDAAGAGAGARGGGGGGRAKGGRVSWVGKEVQEQAC